MGSFLEKNSNAVRKRIENHTFSDEAGEEYEPSAFGGFSDYFRRKKIKLQNLDSELRASSSDKPQIFKGVVAHVSGYTQPPLHVLHRDLVLHGAGFLQYLDSKTMATHIIASSLPPKKIVEFNKYRIVKPAWVADSISAGRLLPWTDYRVIEETPRQKTIKLDGSGISTQRRTQQSPLSVYREQTENSFYTSQVKKFIDALDSSPSKPKSAAATALAREDDLAEVNDSTPMGEQQRSSSNTPQFLSDDNIEHRLEDVSNTEEATSTPFEPPMLKLQPDMEPDELESSALAAQRKTMTSEEHNALLLQDPRMKKSSTANPDFIRQYYSESRLHHLSTWKADLKSKMQKLAAEKSHQRKSTKRKPGSRRYILHVDFDSFFCAVSLKSAPSFSDKPTVVAHGTGDGSEIASCNYPAREFGVKNGMWMKRAKELCPELKVLPYDFPAYEDASRLFYECIVEIGGVVQSVSIDEALVDATSIILSAVGSDGSGIDEGSIWREQEKADQIALSLRDQIKARTGCAVSVGIGGNILLAKVALRKAKPAGQIKPDEVLSFLGGLKVDDLPGVAYSTAGKLEEIGIKFVDDIRQISKERLVSTLGPKTGGKLWDYARGIDKTEVGEQPIRKSVSAEVNWGIRFINQEEAEEFVFNLCKELEKRLLNEQVKGKQLTMKIMRRSMDAPLDPPKHLGHGKCDTFNKSVSFGVATHDHQALGKEAVSILRSYNFSPGDLRGLGVQLTKLEPIKAGLSGPDGSQKRLNFGSVKTTGSATKFAEDPIQDASSVDQLLNSPQGRDSAPDPIVDGPVTPRKPKSHGPHPALRIAQAGEKDAKARLPLNISGTQFILPSNTDPVVLAELPHDIRGKLMAQGQYRSSSEVRDDLSTKSRTQSPAPTEIPPEIDPEVFHALPEDMKAEILGSYRSRSRQTLLPQSPRKDRMIQLTKKTTPTKRRGRSSKERLADANAKIVQTNLFSRKQQADDTGLGEMEELDEAFLAELPEDMRNEVIADYRRRKAQRSGLDLKINPKRDQDGGAKDPLPGGQMRLKFPSPPPKVTFPGSTMTSVIEIRDMLNVWHGETSKDGPHQRDVELFIEYLVKVIVEERDMDKVQKLVRWLDFLIDEDVSEAQPGRVTWRAVVKDVKEGVQKAVRSRGLGPLELG
ncbi:impB/mucB/samB family protein [Xylaria bambusicola]|uniref:impB/mucB/samB family protein n=1 Tax=Xylaria bambusicola TaxID=326684 RepID=UPI002007D2F8|nr:impB/mucB/samB family protein [Xylaria bambusicola]KAI0506115.1 impB/mucB/samB family protein [Xylaria bambusicola]